MKRMKRAGFEVAFWVFGLMLVLSCDFTARADTSTLMELDATEPYDPLIFHADYLWIGKSRKNLSSNYSIDIVDRSNKVIKTLTLSHSIEHIYPYDSQSVIAIGTAPSPNLRHYSIIRVSSRGFEVKDRVVPVTAWGNDWLGTINGREYFSDFGGNSQDEEASDDPYLAMQTIFGIDSSGRAEYLKVRMRSPLNGVRIGEEMYIVRFYQLGDPRRNVYRLNIRSGQFDEMFESPRPMLSDLVPIENNLLAISETGGNRVVFIDRTTKEVKKEISVDGGPRSMQRYGSCLLVGGQLSREASLISIKNLNDPKIIGRIDFSTTGGHFRGLRTLTIDPSTGRLYGRSAYPCNPGMMDCSKSWNSVVFSSDDDAKLVLRQCSE